MRVKSRPWRRYCIFTVTAMIVVLLYVKLYLTKQERTITIDNLKHYSYKQKQPISFDNPKHRLVIQEQPIEIDNPKHETSKQEQPIAIHFPKHLVSKQEQSSTIGTLQHNNTKQEQPIAINNHEQYIAQTEQPTTIGNYSDQQITKHQEPTIISTKYIPNNKWLKNKVTGCNGYFTGYGNEFAWLRYARVDKIKRTFSIPCEEPIPKYNFLFNGGANSPLKVWLENMKRYPLTEISNGNIKSTLTIVVMRIEAHNLYHTLCEWYNVFLLSKLFNFDPRQVDILFMDDRPPGLMDETWDALFGKVTKYSDSETNIVYKNLIWNIIGYDSTVQSHMAPDLQYVHEFHSFFIGAFGVNKTHSLNCSNISVTIIFRRDYMSHPERKTDLNGLIHRKFKNEDEILNEVKTVYLGHNVRAVVLEEMGMKEQVELFTSTDVLIGMHGAGMAHVMFLPSHAAVFELFPTYWGYQDHFKASARWRNLKYLVWHNKDPNNEFPDFYTVIPPYVIRDHSKQLKEYLCPS